MKKKHFIGLSTLLLVLLLGLFTTSYALTENGFKNLMYNYATNQLQYTDTQAKTYVTSAFENCSNMHQYMNDNYLWCVFKDSSYIRFFIEPANMYGTQNAKKTEVYWSSGKLKLYPVCYDGAYFQLADTNLIYATNSPSVMNKLTYTIGTQADLRLYSEQDLYQSNLTTIMYQAPYSSPSWFNSSGAYDINFDYVYNPNLQNVTVQDIPYNNGEMKAITYSGVNNRVYLCIFGDYDQLDHVYMDFYRYNTSLGEWTHYSTVEPYRDFEVEDNQIRLYFSGNYIANTICMLGFIPKSR